MKLVRYGPTGSEKPGLIDGSGILRELDQIIDDIDGASLAPDTLTRLAAIEPSSLPPVAGEPRQGIGRALLEALLHQTTAAGYRRMVAVIGDSANQPSIRLHQTLGFQQAGLIRSVGFKFGRWVDSVIMERPLGEGDASLPE